MRLLASLCEPVARGLRRAMLSAAVATPEIVADATRRRRVRRDGRPESISPGAEQLDRRDDRGAGTAAAGRVDRGAGRRRPGPRARPRRGPARAGGPRPRAHPRSGDGCCSTAPRSPAAPTGGSPSSSSRRPPPRSPRSSRWPTGCPSASARSPGCACRAGPPRRWPRCSPSRPTPSRTTSSRSSTRPASAPAASCVGQIFLEHYVPRWERTPDPALRWEIRG